MLKLNISTQPIRLEYTIQNARLNLQSSRAVVQMKTTLPLLEIRQPRGELTIDHTPCRYSIGLKSLADFARDNAELSRQTGLDNIARIVDEGNRMARIENKTNAIAEIAADTMLVQPPEITYAYINSPIIKYQANPVQFNPIAGRVNCIVQPSPVQCDYRPGSVDIQVTQYPGVKISVVDVQV